MIDDSLTTTNVPPIRMPLRSAGARAASIARSTSLASTVALVLVLGMGAILRFRDINVLGYNSDEAVYAGQAAALAGDPNLSQFFPIFRAHPMAFQYLLALSYDVFGVHDLTGRLLVAIIGLLTIVVVYKAAKELYGAWTGVVAAAIMALMPYHVVVTRQVLLDGPMTFCTTLTLLLLIRYAKTGRPVYLMGVGAGLGLTFMTKETGFVYAAVAFAFLALCPEIKVRLWPLFWAGVCMIIPMTMFPISVSLAGRSDTAQSYLVWQLLRRSNHSWDFFPTVVPPAMGWLVIATALVGVIVLRRHRTWRETLLICWIVIPTIVFQLWPVKGFQYLLPTAPAVAILAARTLTHWRPLPRLHVPRLPSLPVANTLVTALVLVSLIIPSSQLIQAANTRSGLAGAGGLPGVRETGAWIDENLPEGAVLVTIGPSMANLVQRYGHRYAYGLSVSTNPLHRNPSYQPLANPDASIRYGEVQYLVYDAFSASRSTFYANTLARYIEKYDAREVFSYSAPTVDYPEGTKVIIIYEVRP